jgi:hypothetical protein
MKKPKKVKSFFFKDMTHEEMSDLLNEELPIVIRYNEGLINRVHEKYPLISKYEISLIVRAVFESFRDFMVLGKVLNFNKLFFNTKLFFYLSKFDHKTPNLTVQITTPPRLRAKDD